MTENAQHFVLLLFRENKKEEAKENSGSGNPFESDNAPIDDPDNPFFEGDEKDKGQEEQKQQAQSAPPANANKFAGIISQCFEPYLSIYIESQDRNLSDLVERAAQEQRERGCAGMAAEGSAVLHSCGDLFMFYKKCLVQCAQLSPSGARALVSLASVFKKHLRSYASKVLIANLPKASSASSASSLSTSMTTITRELKDFSTAGLLQNFQSLLKEGDAVRLSDDEKVQVCTFLVTSEYCLETTQQLEVEYKTGTFAVLVVQDISLFIIDQAEREVPFAFRGRAGVPVSGAGRLQQRHQQLHPASVPGFGVSL